MEEHFINNLSGHSESVYCSLLFPLINPKYLITGSSCFNVPGNDKEQQGEFKVWDILSGKEIESAISYGHTKPITSLATITKDNIDYLISGSKDGTIIIWKFDKTNFIFEDYQCQFSAQHKQTVTSIAVYSPPIDYEVSETLQNHFFVTVSLDTNAIRWNFNEILRRREVSEKQILKKDDEYSNNNKIRIPIKYEFNKEVHLSKTTINSREITKSYPLSYPINFFNGSKKVNPIETENKSFKKK